MAPPLTASNRHTSHLPTPPASRSSHRPCTPSTETTEAPSIIRNFPKEPKFRPINQDKTRGSEAAQWRQDFVQVIEDHTKDMSIDERTEYFEACVTRNRERYLQTFAAYYGKHPEHIPDRPGGVKSTKQEQEGMQENPAIEAKQNTHFKNGWQSNDKTPGSSPFDRKRTFVANTAAGPRDEVDPSAEPPRCKHCIREARKDKLRNPLDSIKRVCGMKTKARPGSRIPTPVPSLPRDKIESLMTGSSASSVKGGASSADVSRRSSLKQPPVLRGGVQSVFLPPTQHAQHVEQRA